MSLTLDNKKRLEIIEEKVDSVQKNLDLHIADTDKEVGDVQQLRIQVATLIETVNGLERTINRQTDKVSDRVVQAVGPVLEETEDLKKALKGKTIIKIRETFWESIKKLIRRR